MIDDSDIVVGIVDLQIGILVKIIQNQFTIGIFLAFDNDSQAISSGFITYINDTVYLLGKIDIRNLLDQL